MTTTNEKITLLSILQKLGLGSFLLVSFLFFCFGTLFLMMQDPERAMREQPTPNATLVYSKQKVAGPLQLSPEADPGYPSAPLLNRHWLVWTGVKLLPALATQSAGKTKRGIFVYDFITQQRRFLEHSSWILWFDGNDTVSYYRNGELYAYNLKTQNERLLLNLKANQIPAVYDEALIEPPIFNGTHLFWSEGYPANCLPRPTCQQIYQNVCKRVLFVYDLQTKTRRALGLLPYGTRFSGRPTSTKLILYTPRGEADCYPKVFPGESSVFDFISGKILSFNSGIYQYGPEFIKADGNIITYSSNWIEAKYTRLVNFASIHEPQPLLYFDQIPAVGTAGLHVLLYTPGDNSIASTKKLIALDIKNGATQTLDERNNIQSATGDSEHFAWTTADGDLYVAPVNLVPAPKPTPTKTRIPPKLPWTQTQIEPVK